MAFINADCDKIAVENPIGYMNTHYRKPDQIIHPWQFRLSEEEAVSKNTCLWLKGLPKLVPTYTTPPQFRYKEWYDERAKRHKRQDAWYWEAYAKAKTQDERAKWRSKTFLGIANAFATQWG